ncbi:MAG: hypothetical protein QM759_05900 [Terricaulis sp.]
MVSSIVPGTAGANTLGVDTRFKHHHTAGTQTNDNSASGGDRVDVSGPAAWAAARDSVTNGLAQLDAAMSAGRDAQNMLLAAQSAGSQADLDGLLQNYSAGVSDAIAGGAVLVGGGSISVQAEPGAAPLAISGGNLQLGADGSVLSLASDAQLSDPAFQGQVQGSLDAVQSMMTRYSDAARGLQAHQGFLGAVNDVNANVRTDLDADGARLLALQVRQGLDGAGVGAIANADPQAVLSLFRA